MTILDSEFGYLEIEPHDPAERRSDRDVILLLHGLGGNKSDWAYPKWRSQHWDYRVLAENRKKNNQWFPPPMLYPLPYWERLGLSRKRDWARCWRGALLAKGHTVINYSQEGPQEAVEVPLQQLQEDIAPFIRGQVLTDQLANKRIVVLCHSRGGILARSYLRDNPDASDWISHVITLCSPHRGTDAPGSKERLADEAAIIAAVSGFPFSVIAIGIAVARLLDVFQESAGARQLFPDDPIFNDLPIPADFPSITFSTYGGTSPAYSDIYHYFYAPQSFLPNFFDFPDVRFDWLAQPVQIPGLSPLLNAIPDILVDDEQKDGNGDGLVTNFSASLPGATHVSLPINHIEALYDETLFQRVLQLLGTPMDGTEDFTCVQPLIGNARTLQLHDPLNEKVNCQLDEIHEIRPFERIEDALAEGYDGCYYCLREHHTVE